MSPHKWNAGRFNWGRLAQSSTQNKGIQRKVRGCLKGGVRGRNTKRGEVLGESFYSRSDFEEFLGEIGRSKREY